MVATVALICSGVFRGFVVGQEVQADAAETVAPHTCSRASVLAMSDLLGSPALDQERQALAHTLPEDDASMIQVQEAAHRLGFTLTGVAGTVDQLGSVLGPKILHLNDPAHFVVLVRTDDQWTQIMDGGRLTVVAREDLEARYSGKALICELPDGEGGPNLEMESFHHSFGVAGVGQKIDKAFTVRNAGQQPLTIESKQGGG